MSIGNGDLEGSGAIIGSLPLAIVIDTNVWLDWLVFHDPGIAWLRALQAAGGCRLVHADDTRRELELVLARPIFALDATAQAQALALHDAVSARFAAPRPDCGLRCTDRDDQRFIDLAAAVGAALLLTKDRALLKLDRRARRLWGLRVCRPWPAPEIVAPVHRNA